MGYFFRRSAKIGPFRLNFSKSGIGASVGVKGARITMTPRGTTYVTAGSHGFYYLETLSNRGSRPNPTPSSPYIAPAPPHPSDDILTADVSDLVDSSSERLVQQLNERAKMGNPAWVLYPVAAIVLFIGLTNFSTAPTLPNLPDVPRPFTARKSNTADEYSALTARFGEPDSISYLEADKQAPIAVGTATYNSADVRIAFVPNGCVEAYEQVMNIVADRAEYPALAKSKIKLVSKCVPSAAAGWTTIAYGYPAGKWDMSAQTATGRLDSITAKRTMPPKLENRDDAGSDRKQLKSSATTRMPATVRMQSTSQAHVAFEQIQRRISTARTSTQISMFALTLGGLGLFCWGIIVHKRNSEKRISRLFYELERSGAAEVRYCPRFGNTTYKGASNFAD